MLSGDSHSGDTRETTTADDGAVGDAAGAAGAGAAGAAGADVGVGWGRAGAVMPSDIDCSAVPVIADRGVGSVLEVLEAQVAVLGRIETVGISNADRRALLMRAERVSRVLFALSHTWVADLVGQHGLDGVWGSTPEALAVLLGVSKARAGQRLRYGQQFGVRTAMSGERVAPVLAATAAVACSGVLDEAHQDIVRKFFRKLGSKVDEATRVSAEVQLAQLASELGPDHFAVAARRLYDVLDPDGDLDEEQLADRCYVRLDAQGENGLSKGRFVVDAELRAYLEAVFDKWAKPGMNNPADAVPVTDNPDDPDTTDDPDSTDTGSTGSTDSPDTGSDSSDGDVGVGCGSGAGVSEGSGADPGLFDETFDGDGGEDVGAEADGGEGGGGEPEGESESESGAESESTAAAGAAAGVEWEARVARDRRGQGRRQHDAVKVVLRQMLASGRLGAHRGLPVTAVVTMSLAELEAGCGFAVTGTGSVVRMRDAIRMASHARHYLAIFGDDGRPLYLGRSKRIASADQRIVLMASDRGCTFPGCTRPATWSQVHHIDEWADGGGTDIDKLTFGCDMHHPLITSAVGGWATTKAGADHRYPGRTLWHPPESVDPLRRGRVNHFHHPGEYIYAETDVPLPGFEDPYSTDTTETATDVAGPNATQTRTTAAGSDEQGRDDLSHGPDRGSPPA